MKASAVIDELYKIASYMEPIKCEQCSFEGIPNSDDGRCPECGAMGGIKPKHKPGKGREVMPHSRDLAIGKLHDAIQQAKSEMYHLNTW